MISILLSLSAFAHEANDTIINKKAKEATLKSKIFVPPLVIKTCPTAILWGAIFPPFTAEYRLTAEITSGKRQSDQLSISLLGKNLFLNMFEKAANVPTDYTFKVNGWRIQYAHKFYLVGKRRYAPYGFYVAPLISYTEANVAVGLKRYYEKNYYEFRHFNINGIVGIQAGKLNRMTIDIYAGLGYKNNKFFHHINSYKVIQLDTEDFGEVYNSHLNGVFGISLGYSF